MSAVGEVILSPEPVVLPLVSMIGKSEVQDLETLMLLKFFKAVDYTALLIHLMENVIGKKLKNE